MSARHSFADSGHIRQIIFRTVGLRHGSPEHWKIRNTAYRAARHPHIGAEYI